MYLVIDLKKEAITHLCFTVKHRFRRYQDEFIKEGKSDWLID
jgi:hypothetical protein